MKPNMGTTDKVIRIILGVVIIVLGIIYQSWWGLIGLIPIVVSLTSRCYLYKICGISTLKKTEPADNK